MRVSKYKSKKMKMATGGVVNELSGLAPVLMALLDGGNKSYSNQPIVNASVARNMVNPYKFAFGGDFSDVDPDQIRALQDEADNRGISVDELIQDLNSDEGDNDEDDTDNGASDDDSDDSDTDDIFKYGGIIKKKGKSKNKVIRKFAFGGNNIEVEGNEIVQEPGKAPYKVVGPKHEEGGVDVSVKDGTKVFSDRLKIDGKSMQERKAARVRRMGKLDRLLIKTPNDNLLKNSVLRTKTVTDNQEQKDMMLQNMANKIYSQPQKHAFGGDIDTDGYVNPDDAVNMGYNGTYNPSADYLNSIGSIDNTTGVEYTPNANKPVAANGADKFTTGDYVGTAGSIFGAVAPLLTTLADKRHTPPVVNRYKGIGQRAIDANDTAQGYLSRTKQETISDINETANNATARNRNGASSINTSRALDAVTTLGRNKAIGGAESRFATGMTGLMSQRGQLTNFQDQYEDYGQTQADNATQANTDNFYSNLTANFAGIGNAGQAIGRNFNISKSNTIDRKLISQLSKYGLNIDENGNLVNS